jgi:hypothetical protein
MTEDVFRVLRGLIPSISIMSSIRRLTRSEGRTIWYPFQITGYRQMDTRIREYDESCHMSMTKVVFRV